MSDSASAAVRPPAVPVDVPPALAETQPPAAGGGAHVAGRPRPGPGRMLDAAGAAVRRPGPSVVRAAPGIAKAAPGIAKAAPAVAKAAPNLARVAAASAWQVVSWSVGATVAGATYIAERAAEGEAPAAIMQQAAAELRTMAWRALGVDDEARRPLPGGRGEDDRPETPQELQQRGTDLLRRSNDVHIVEDTHPAFARILTEITPDEARILRFIYLDGTQPSVDVRTFRLFGIGSTLVAAGLNMIAENAGCRDVTRIDPYLTNLARLGLIAFSKEQVSNPQRYQVVEAQPKVTAALKRAGRMPRTIHRSILLTSFGAEFVRTCLPLNGRVSSRRELSGRQRDAGE